MPPRVARPSRFLPVILAAIAIPATLALPARAEERPRTVRLMDRPGIAQLKRDLIWREYRAEQKERAERARERARAARQGAQARLPEGRKVRPEVPDEDLRAGRLVPGATRIADPPPIISAPANVLVNDKTGDGPTAGQAEQSVAMLGNFGLAAWNDGQGFNTGGDTQRAAWTADGGVTWTRVDIPHPPGAPTDYWVSDPVVTVNEKTGKFYYCGLTTPSATSNGISVVGGHFSGGAFQWETVFVVRSGSNASIGFDKEWMVADSSSGNLYLSYTVFGTADTIVFQRSTNGGANWDSPIKLNTSGYGRVQGSRPAVGPTGDLYVAWKEIGTVDVDYLRYRKSTNHGVSFASQGTITQFYDNFGTGAPGFNRERSIAFPAVVVDRSSDPQRGRIHVTWNESLNYYDDNLGGAGDKSEIENDNFFSRATPFTIGQEVRGSLSTGDLDYFSFSATQGQTCVFYLDSLRSTLNYTMRVFCGADTATRLAYTGDPDPAYGSGSGSVLAWTAPATGTYYLRMAQTGSTGGYHIWTGLASQGPERGRDQRDAFASDSDNGVSWSTAVRLNDDSPWYDNWLPEIGVSREGYVYSMWYDWRDSPANCGGRSHIYAARSVNGGGAWSANVTVTDTLTAWTTTASNIAPNQGDYNAIFCSDVAAFSWADGRRGDADVFFAKSALLATVACPPDSEWGIGATHSFPVHVVQPNVLFANDYNWTLIGDRAWPGLPATGSVPNWAGGAHLISIPVAVPDSAAMGWTRLCFKLSQPNGVALDSCCADYLLLPLSGVGPVARGGLELRGVWPNPASRSLNVSFSLPSAGAATLELVDLAGRRVAAREVGALGPGPHVLDLSREAARMRPGVYSVRLAQGSGAVSSKVAIVR